jgi:hypothetical protein
MATGLNDDSARTAVKAAAVAAGSSAVVLAARRALARRNRNRADLGEALSEGLDAAWNAAQEAMLPAIGDAASAAGRYVGERAPDIVRESILPRFIDGYQEAHERHATESTDDQHDRRE